MTHMAQMPTPNTMNNFVANQFDPAAVYSTGLQQQQQQQQQQQFCNNNKNNNINGGMNPNQMPQHAMLNNNNNNSMMMMNFQQQQQQNPMPMLAAQQQQAMMNLVLHQEQQQQQQQNQQQQQQQNQQRLQQQFMSVPTLAGRSSVQGSQNMLNNTLVAKAPIPPKVSLSSFLEPRPIGGDGVRSSCIQEHQYSKRPDEELLYEDEYIAPLRMSPKKMPSKMRKDDLEASSSSLMVDSIFSTAEKNRSTTKLNSSGLSIMSLSVNNIGNESDVDPDNLGRLFDSSLKLSHQSSTTSLAVKPPKSPYKRSVSHDESITQEKGMASVLEMSLNTIGDELSEFDDSYAIMNDDMSFANVFGDGGGEYR